MTKDHHCYPVGRRLFTDRAVRDVFEDAAGQFILDADSVPVWGQWLSPLDEPLVIDTGGRITMG
jgi:hypothetical protein